MNNININININKWKISGAAVQGRRHAENNTPCQDKIFSLCKNGVTSIALADGAV